MQATSNLCWIPVNQYEPPRELRGWVKTCFVLFPLMAFLSACSHIGQVQSAEKAVSTAQTALSNSKAAVDARGSDYAQELKYDVGLMPAGPNVTVASEITGLMVDLLGPGKLTQSKRQAFVDKLLKDDLAAHRALYQAGKNDDALKATVMQKDTQLTAKETQLKVVSEKAATVADDLDSWLHIFIWILVAGAVYVIVRIVIILGAQGAAIAAKVP
jgi:glucose/arabinose dehydrogenase